MFSRIVQLCLRPAEGQLGSQLLSSHAATHFQQLSASMLQLAMFQQQVQQFSSNTAEEQAQKQPASTAARASIKELFKPSQQLLSKIQEAQPTQARMQLLKTVLLCEEPMTSPDLFVRMQQEYGSKRFATRQEFKRHLKSLKNSRLVTAKPPAVQGKGAKGDTHYVFSGTKLGFSVDLETPAHGLQATAQVQADDWTKKHLPQYAEHMRAGRVRVTANNLGVLEPDERLHHFRKSLFGSSAVRGQGAAAGAGAGAPSAAEKQGRTALAGSSSRQSQE